jgi:hypothetical protein
VKKLARLSLGHLLSLATVLLTTGIITSFRPLPCPPSSICKLFLSHLSTLLVTDVQLVT